MWLSKSQQDHLVQKTLDIEQYSYQSRLKSPDTAYDHDAQAHTTTHN